MSSWEEDLLDWIDSNLESPPSLERLRKVEGALIRYGWEPEFYDSSMREELHQWLSLHYTLSSKVKPVPSTGSADLHFKKLNYVGSCGRVYPEEYLVQDWNQVSCERCHGAKSRRSI